MAFAPEEPLNNVPVLEDITVTSQDCFEAINSLNKSSSPGPDGMTVSYLVKCQDIIAPCLPKLLTKSIKARSLPTLMKLAFITPVFKGGNRNDPGCYRPVSVTSNVCKVWEKIKIAKILDFLATNELLPTNQHGFRAGYSTMTQLIEHFEDIVEGLEAEKSVDVIYLDFAKCFDKLDFRLLLNRLHSIGIRGSVLSWIEAFLVGRFQRVKVNGVLGAGNIWSSTGYLSWTPSIHPVHSTHG